ncbi:570_t:CDS:1 [Rhizophagus irregularis]|nr:570_t:CDS:1 [Rhizophagus irregularis]
MAINRVRDRCKDNQDPHLILVNQRQNTDNTFQQKSRNVVSQEKISQNFKKIYGEYISFISHNEGFIFSFENDNVKNTKISRNINDSISFNSFNESSGQNVHVKMSEYCNGNVVRKNENFVPKEVEIFIVYKIK